MRSAESEPPDPPAWRELGETRTSRLLEEIRAHPPSMTCFPHSTNEAMNPRSRLLRRLKQESLRHRRRWVAQSVAMLVWLGRQGARTSGSPAEMWGWGPAEQS